MQATLSVVTLGHLISGSKHYFGFQSTDEQAKKLEQLEAEEFWPWVGQKNLCVEALDMASRCLNSLRSFTRASHIRSRTPSAARYMATATESHKSTSTPPTPAKSSVSADSTISQIVDDISGLTLLQAADLVAQLKTRLNIQEIAMPAAAAPPPAATPADDEPVAVKPKEKTVFNFKLESFDAAVKPKVIREVKALIPNLTLMDAKKMVESAPKVLKENVSKEDAEKLKKAFESIGAVVTLE